MVLSFLLIREDLPLLGELDPNHLHEVTASSKEEVEGAVGVVEPVQQHLGHLLLLLPDKPETNDQLGSLAKICGWRQNLNFLTFSFPPLAFAFLQSGFPEVQVWR